MIYRSAEFHLAWLHWSIGDRHLAGGEENVCPATILLFFYVILPQKYYHKKLRIFDNLLSYVNL